MQSVPLLLRCRARTSEIIRRKVCKKSCSDASLLFLLKGLRVSNHSFDASELRDRSETKTKKLTGMFGH